MKKVQSNRREHTIVKLLLGLTVAAILLGVALDSYCTHSSIAFGPLGFSTASNSVCSEFYFMWGGDVPAWLTPHHLIVHALEHIGVNHIVAAIINTVIWIFIGGALIHLALPWATTRAKRWISWGIFAVIFVLMLGSIFVYRETGSRLLWWERQCTQLDKIIIREEYQNCVVHYYNVSNSVQAARESYSIASCPHPIDADYVIDSLQYMSTLGADRYAIDALMTKCLCRSEATNTTITQYLSTHPVSGSIVGSRSNIVDAGVACGALK